MSDEKKRPITPDDVEQIQHVDEVTISPDGQWIAYVLTTPNMMEHGYSRNIYLMSTGGGEPLQITRGGKDTSPKWSPDGRQIAFMSTRNGAPQIYILPVQGMGGEARQLTRHERGAMAPAWSPDGKQIAYLSRLNEDEMKREDSDEAEEPPKDALEGKHRKERREEDEKQRFDPRWTTRIPYRTGTNFLDDRFSQIYVTGTEENSDDDNNKPRRLTGALADYSPPRWAADGKAIYTTRSYQPDADEPWMYSNVYRIDVDSGEETRIVDEKFSVGMVEPSPDGKWLAAVRNETKKTDSFTEFIVLPTNGGDAIVLNEKIDRTVAFAVEWRRDGELYAIVAADGYYPVYRADIDAQDMQPVASGTFTAFGFDVADDGAIAMSMTTAENPSELAYQSADSDQITVLTNHNKWLDKVNVLKTEDIRFKGGDGKTDIQGWYILPPDYEDGKTYPLALNIHGGPHVQWSAAFRSMWIEWQHHAAQGYVSFFCNPRGSSGYGQDFMSAIHSDWGDVAMSDIMAGVDTLIERGIVDEKRMAITGGSYGGYMTAWIIGHTDRFASAVAQRGVYNLISFYGTSDVPVLISSEFDAEPWEDTDKLWQHSPLAYVKNMDTPLLIIHSENDYRVPIEQAEQLFAQVRRKGGTVKMVRYPGEGHELSRSGDPVRRIHRLNAIMDWFNEYISPDKKDQA